MTEHIETALAAATESDVERAIPHAGLGHDCATYDTPIAAEPHTQIAWRA
jgi:hypothetical protein